MARVTVIMSVKLGVHFFICVEIILSSYMIDFTNQETYNNDKQNLILYTLEEDGLMKCKRLLKLHAIL